MAKYRPVLTESQISHICSLCRLDSSKESLIVLSALASFEYKIKMGAVAPAYAGASQKESLSSSLGFDSQSEPAEAEVSGLLITASHSSHSADKLSNHDSEALYQRWLESPDGFSISELKAIQFYRYRNGKMLPHEERKYEAETLGMPD